MFGGVIVKGHIKSTWPIGPPICIRKEYRGTWVLNLQDMNICLIGSCVKRHIPGEGSLWKRIWDSKYNTRNPNILCCEGSHPSQFWKSFQWALQAVKLGYKWHVGNGRMVRFWEDTWHGNAPLATQCWDFYYLVHQKNKTIVNYGMGLRLNIYLGEFFLMI